MPSESCCAGGWTTVAFFFFDAKFAPAPVSVASSLYIASILCSMTISDFFFSPTSSCRTLLLPLHPAVGVEMIHPPSFARLNPRKPHFHPAKSIPAHTKIPRALYDFHYLPTCLHLCTYLCIFLAFKEEVKPGSNVTMKLEADSLKRALTSLNRALKEP